MTDESIRILSRELCRSRWVLFFTGAGISTGSGIPDFRGPQGIWTRWKPVYYQDFLVDPAARLRHWEYKLETWQDFRKARPNAAHLALAELERLGRLDLLVTQNIDGLHQLAGIPEDKIVELHGTNRSIECVSCGRRLEPERVYEEFARNRRVPECSCGGYLKPATVSFGQLMPAEEWNRATLGARTADLVIAIGSTLEVEPAAGIPRLAKKSGAFYAIINRGPTSQDGMADLQIEGDAVTILPRLVEDVSETSRRNEDAGPTVDRD